MSRAEKIARRWLSAAAVATLAMLFALAVVTRSPWALFGVVPFGCLLIAAEYLNDATLDIRLSAYDSRQRRAR